MRLSRRALFALPVALPAMAVAKPLATGGVASGVAMLGNYGPGNDRELVVTLGEVHARIVYECVRQFHGELQRTILREWPATDVYRAAWDAFDNANRSGDWRSVDPPRRR